MRVMIADEDAPMMDTTPSQSSTITISSQSSEEHLRPWVDSNHEAAAAGAAAVKSSPESQVSVGSQFSLTDEMRPQEEQHHEDVIPVATAAGTKRHRIVQIEDEVGMVSSPKYPKLLTTPPVLVPQEAQSASSSSGGYLDEPPETADANQEEKDHLTKELPVPAFEEEEHTKQLPVPAFEEEEQVLAEDPPADESDSEGGSIGISPQRDIPNDLISAIGEKESSEAISNLMLVSTGLNIQNHINHTSQYEPNDILEYNDQSIVNSVTTIKQSNSQPFSSCEENTEEPVNVISIPETSSLNGSREEYIYQEESDQNEAHSNDGVTEGEAGLQNVVPSGLYAVATQSLREPNLKTENSNSQDPNSQHTPQFSQSQDICQVQIHEEQSLRNQVYPHIHQIQVIDNQIPSTSRGFEENSYGLNRAGSVSELNLAHLVLGLRSDIQKLTEKVEKQELILDTVVNVNNVNLAPMFSPSFQEKYNLKVPFTKIEDFMKFNDDLDKSQTFCTEFVTSLLAYLDNETSLAKNILNMVKHYMSKDLALLFNASKPTPNKMVLKDTMFCKCLLQAYKVGIKDEKLPLEREKTFMKHLGPVISGARGWHNHNDE